MAHDISIPQGTEPKWHGLTTPVAVHSVFLNPDFAEANEAAQTDGTEDMTDEERAAFYSFEALGESLSAKPQGYEVDTVDPDDPTLDAEYEAYLAQAGQDADYDTVLPSVEGGRALVSLLTAGEGEDDDAAYREWLGQFSGNTSGPSAQPQPPAKPNFHGVVVSRVYQQMCATPASFDSLIKSRGYWQARLDIAAAEQDYLYFTYGADHSTDEVALWVGEVMAQLGCTPFTGPTPPQAQPQPEPITNTFTEANVLAYMRSVVDGDWETGDLNLPRHPAKLLLDTQAGYDTVCELMRLTHLAFYNSTEYDPGKGSPYMWDWAVEVLREKKVMA
jgi:hypothetical protein